MLILECLWAFSQCISNAVRVDPEAINYYAEPFYHLGKVLDHFEAEIDYNELSQDQDRQVGELILLGKSVGKGYINSDNIKKSGFYKKLDESGKLQAAYRTGDLFYLDNDANLCFVGRNDNQIKRSGYRIELQD